MWHVKNPGHGSRQAGGNGRFSAKAWPVDAAWAVFFRAGYLFFARLGNKLAAMLLANIC